MAALQVLQWGICDQGAVIQLDHLQAVVSAGAAAEVSDAIISDQLTVWQTQDLQTRTMDRQLDQSSICDLHTFF